MIKNLFALLILASTANGQVEIYNEDFQSGLPASYTIINNDGFTPDNVIVGFDSAWVELVDPSDSTDTIVGSTSFFSPAGQSDRWLITPAITIGAFGNVLYWNAKSHDPSFPDDYLVLISTTDTQLSNFTDTIYSIINELENWQTRNVIISDSGYINQTVHIAFVNRTYDGFKLYIDDIRMEINDPVGLSDKELNRISLYPNPASEFIKISNSPKGAEFTIYNVAGELLLTTFNTSIGISSLANGHYTLVAKTDSTISRTTIIKH